MEYFHFSLTATREVGLRIRRLDYNADLYVEDHDGNVIASSENTGDAKEVLNVTLLANDAGEHYYVRVEAKEDGTDDYQFRYFAEAPPNVAATGAPTIKGAVAVGKTLTADTSGITADNGLTNAVFTYQWVRNTDGADAEISGGTGSTYTITASDAGLSFKVTVAFTDDAGYSENLTSDATETLPEEASDRQVRSSHTLSLSADVTKKEGDNFNMTVTLSPAHTAVVTVKFRLVPGSDGTAESGDYQFDGSNTVSFTAGQTSKTISLDIVNDADADAEDEEFFYVELFDATGGATIGDGTAKVTIAIDSNRPDTTEITVPDRVQTVGQDVGNVVWTPQVDAFQPESGTTTVEYTTVDGTAMAGTHYTAVSGTLTVNRGNATTHKIEVPILNTSALDDKTFTVALSNPANTDIDVTPVFINNSATLSATIEGVTILTEHDVAVDWPLIPADLGGGDSFRLIFISSTNRNAVPTGISSYNTFVQDRAAAGHSAIQSYSSQFRVVGSTEDIDARDNTETTGTGVPIYWLGGNKVADDYADFYDGTWDDETNATHESGNIRTSTDNPFTGSKNDGTEKRFASSSLGLGTTGTLGVTAGVLNHPSGNPLESDGTLAGTNEQPFYGLSPIFNVDIGAPRAPTGLSATAGHQTWINLSWTAPAHDNGAAVTGHKIEVSDDGGTNWSNLVANTGNTDTIYFHTGLSAESTRHYRVSAINSEGTSAASVVADATTPEKSNLKPGITGTSRVGQTLTATLGNIVDPDGLPATFPDDYTFQWVRVNSLGGETEIGMDSGTYTLVAADVNKKIRVKVSFTDGAGNPEGPLASDPYPSSGNGKIRPSVNVSGLKILGGARAKDENGNDLDRSGFRFVGTSSNRINRRVTGAALCQCPAHPDTGQRDACPRQHHLQPGAARTRSGRASCTVRLPGGCRCARHVRDRQ